MGTSSWSGTFLNTRLGQAGGAGRCAGCAGMEARGLSCTGCLGPWLEPAAQGGPRGGRAAAAAGGAWDALEFSLMGWPVPLQREPGTHGGKFFFFK